MKRLAVALTALLLVTGANFAAASEPQVMTAAAQEAMADWMRIDGSTGYWYIAIGGRYPTEEGLQTIGGVGRGQCWAEKTRFGKSITCLAMVRIKQLPLDAFSIDPLLSKATLTVKQGGRTNTVTWTGRGDLPQSQGEISNSDEDSYVAITSYRSARASGRVFGVKLAPKRYDMADLFEGAMAGVYFGDVRATEVAPNLYRVKKTFRLAR